MKNNHLKAPKYLKKHIGWDVEDYLYLSEKGYKNREIEQIWNDDQKTKNLKFSWTPKLVA